jgi:hypothetical protein
MRTIPSRRKTYTQSFVLIALCRLDVAGMAAAILSQNPLLTPQQVRDAIVNKALMKPSTSTTPTWYIATDCSSASVITSSPTTQPTLKPTTKSPTSIPTANPTTKSPTSLPTSGSTTVIPTVSPTGVPSFLPTTSSPTDCTCVCPSSTTS